MRFTKGIAVLAVSVTLSACVTDRPHNDVMIFGTDTSLAVKVGAPPMNGAIPKFIVGYDRSEGVWMPLMPSSNPGHADDKVDATVGQLNTCALQLKNSIAEAKVAETCLTIVLAADKYISYSAGINSEKGGAAGEIDTYSVFASFGAEGGLGFNSASGKLAQFFATGIAAQRLGANPNVGLALNAEAPEAIEKQAEAKVEEAKAESEAYKAGVDIGNSALTDANRIVACRAPNKPSKADYDSFVDAAKAAVDDGQKRIVDGFKAYPDESTFKSSLLRFKNIRSAFLAETVKTCS